MDEQLKAHAKDGAIPYGTLLRQEAEDLPSSRCSLFQRLALFVAVALAGFRASTMARDLQCRIRGATISSTRSWRIFLGNNASHSLATAQMGCAEKLESRPA